MAQGERLVAIGLLTQRDLDVLGTGFRRLFPLPNSPADFDTLIVAIDEAEHQLRTAPRLPH